MFIMVNSCGGHAFEAVSETCVCIALSFFYSSLYRCDFLARHIIWCIQLWLLMPWLALGFTCFHLSIALWVLSSFTAYASEATLYVDFYSRIV